MGTKPVQLRMGVTYTLLKLALLEHKSHPKLKWYYCNSCSGRFGNQLFVLQVSYAIGVAEPLSLYIDTYGTGKKTNKELREIIKKNFDLRPGVIIK